jgi:hypothetical protein
MPASSLGGGEALAQSGRTLLHAILDAQKKDAEVKSDSGPGWWLFGFLLTTTAMPLAQSCCSRLVYVASLAKRDNNAQPYAGGCVRNPPTSSAPQEQPSTGTLRAPNCRAQPLAQPAARSFACPAPDWSEQAISLATGAGGEEAVTGLMIVYPTCLVQCIEVSAAAGRRHQRPDMHPPSMRLPCCLITARPEPVGPRWSSTGSAARSPQAKPSVLRTIMQQLAAADPSATNVASTKVLLCAELCPQRLFAARLAAFVSGGGGAADAGEGAADAESFVAAAGQVLGGFLVMGSVMAGLEEVRGQSRWSRGTERPPARNQHFAASIHQRDLELAAVSAAAHNNVLEQQGWRGNGTASHEYGCWVLLESSGAAPPPCCRRPCSSTWSPSPPTTQQRPLLTSSPRWRPPRQAVYSGVAPSPLRSRAGLSAPALAKQSHAAATSRPCPQAAPSIAQHLHIYSTAHTLPLARERCWPAPAPVPDFLLSSQ